MDTLSHKNTRGEADHRQPPESAGRRLGYKFDPVPQEVNDAIWQARANRSDRDKATDLKRVDADVLAALLRFRYRTVDSCWTSKQKVAETIGRTIRTVQSSYRRLEINGLIRMVAVGPIDLDEPINRTGWRIFFPWLSATRDAPEPILPRSAQPPDAKEISRDRSKKFREAAKKISPNIDEPNSDELNPDESSSKAPPPEPQPEKNDDDDEVRSSLDKEIEEVARVAEKYVGPELAGSVRRDAHAVRKATKGKPHLFTAAIRLMAFRGGWKSNPFGWCYTTAKDFADNPSKADPYLIDIEEAIAASLREEDPVRAAVFEAEPGTPAAEALNVVSRLVARGVEFKLWPDGKVHWLLPDLRPEGSGESEPPIYAEPPTVDEKADLIRMKSEVVALLKAAPEVGIPRRRDRHSMTMEACRRMLAGDDEAAA